MSFEILSFYRWIECLRLALTTESFVRGDMISWSAYHASHQALPLTKSDVCLTFMLPLFCDATNSVAMICHAMNVVKNAVEILIQVRYQSSHVCTSQKITVELARITWRKHVCCNVWWAAYRDGCS